jgi:transposase
MIPYDKFKPGNIIRAQEFVNIVPMVDPNRLKFGDEKLVKGAGVFCQRTRRNVLTGEVPPCCTASDFRNTYPVVAFCGIDLSTMPVYYRIHDGKNDSESFSRDIETAVSMGFFKGGDILVLDNAAIHDKGENTYLEEWHLETFGIFILFLPTRMPEWNPTELLWRLLVQLLKNYPIRLLRQFSKDAPAHATDDILSKVTHREIAGMYMKCNYLSSFK